MKALGSNRRTRWNRDRRVAECWAACARAKCGDDIQTSLRVRRAQIMSRQQAMSLRAHVTHRKNSISHYFVLNAKVVLLGVLRPQFRLQFSKERDRTEVRPAGIRSEEHTSELQSL